MLIKTKTHLLKKVRYDYIVIIIKIFVNF